MASQLDGEVPAGRQLLEVVAGDVGVQVEALRHLGRGDPVGAGPDEQVDVARVGSPKALVTALTAALNSSALSLMPLGFAAGSVMPVFYLCT